MSLADRIADFVERQYVAEDGDVRDNVERLFAEDLAYHARGEVLGREDVVAMGFAVRATSRQGREFALSGWEEDGSTVRWRLSATLPGMGVAGRDVRQDSELTATFGADGLVHEVWSRDLDPR